MQVIGAIAISVIVNQIINFIWYGPLFGTTFNRLMAQWRKQRSPTPKTPKPSPTEMGLYFSSSLVGSILIASTIMSVLLLSSTSTVYEGALKGFYLSFIAMGINLIHAGWEQKPIALIVMYETNHMLTMTLHGALMAFMIAPQSPSAYLN